jgi:hypothetical protein
MYGIAVWHCIWHSSYIHMCMCGIANGCACVALQMACVHVSNSKVVHASTSITAFLWFTHNVTCSETTTCNYVGLVMSYHVTPVLFCMCDTMSVFIVMVLLIHITQPCIRKGFCMCACMPMQTCSLKYALQYYLHLQ